MDMLTFIAEVVKASAWPLVVITIVLIFRQQLSALLSRIRKGKFGPAEFEFEQEVKALSEQVPPQQLPAQQVNTPTLSLATNNSRAAILEAWFQVESAANRVAYFRQIPSPSVPRNLASIIRAIEKSGLVSLEEVALFNELRVLRNLATHDPDFSPSAESAMQYVQLAQGLKERLDRIAEEH